MGGFSIKLGSCSKTEAEIWAVIYGLRMAWDQGIRRLVVEVDSSPVAKCLNTKEKGSSKTGNLMEVCIQLIQQQQEVVIKHVYREANQVVDLLANLAMDHPIGELKSWTSPSTASCRLIQMEKTGTFWARRVPNIL